MNFMNSSCLVTVPSITVIVRKAYGRAYGQCVRYNDEMIARPTAEVSFMDPNFATGIVHGVDIGEEGFTCTGRHSEGLAVWDMATIFTAEHREPQETRDYLIRMLVGRLERTAAW